MHFIHFIVGIAAVGALVWFVSGERMARAFVGAALAALAVVVLLFVGTMLYVVHRDNAAHTAGRARTASCVKVMNTTGACR